MLYDFPDYIPTEQDHAFGDLLDRLEAAIAHELARSCTLMEELGLLPHSQHLPAAAAEMLGHAWELYCHHAHGPDPTAQATV